MAKKAEGNKDVGWLIRKADAFSTQEPTSS